VAFWRDASPDGASVLATGDQHQPVAERNGDDLDEGE
jgi:hypothetical protein